MKENKVIIFPNEMGGVSVLTAALECPLTFEEIEKKDVPSHLPRKIVDKESLPSTHIFRDAWEYSENGVIINIDKAKDITHALRREARKNEFLPFDETIAKRIPGTDMDIAETMRLKIRERYAVIQNEINACNDIGLLEALFKIIQFVNIKSQE